MNKEHMIGEAIETLYDSEDDGSIHPDILRKRIATTVESCWQDGMTLEGLIQASRRKLRG